MHDLAETHSHFCSNSTAATAATADQSAWNDHEAKDGHAMIDDVTQTPPDVADLFPISKKHFSHKDDHAHAHHHHPDAVKDFHGGQVPEQDLPPPTVDKNVPKIKPNATAKQLLKLLWKFIFVWTHLYLIVSEWVRAGHSYLKSV